MKILSAFMLVVISISLLSAQTKNRLHRIYLKEYGASLPKMSYKDFQIGPIGLKIRYDSIVNIFGNPDSSKKNNDLWPDFTAHYFSKFVVWTNNQDQRIWTLDVYDSTLITNRGLKIGDSVNSIDRVYPTKTFNIHQRMFNRVGPYDTSFINYSEYRLYDYMPSDDEGWVLILFTKNDILTKILFYVGIPE